MIQEKINTFFSGRKLVIATMHKKEEVIAPFFSEFLKLKCITDPKLNTDTLGTFTGEIPRLTNPLETARKKCLLAINNSQCDLAIASEGSFGPHPNYGFINVNEEFLLFIDTKNNLEIYVRELSLHTNFNGKEIETEEELSDFATSVKFPSHGLILRNGYGENFETVKGITNHNSLNKHFKIFKEKYGKVYVETDMRAMFNPSRMDVIKTAAQKLVNKIMSLCPQCNTPGFGVKLSKPGLPCIQCHFPTQSVLFNEYQCVKCAFVKTEMYPYGKSYEDPTFCDICNP